MRNLYHLLSGNRCCGCMRMGSRMKEGGCHDLPGPLGQCPFASPMEEKCED